MVFLGNYVNLYIGDNVYFMCIILILFLDENVYFFFVWVYCFFVVNMNDIESMKVVDSGDGVIRLKNGYMVKMLRRYKLIFDK